MARKVAGKRNKKNDFNLLFIACCVLYPFLILSLSLFLLFTHLQHLFLFLLSQSCRTVAFCSRCFMTLTIDLAGLCRRRGRGSRAEREEGGDHLVAGSAGSNNGMLGILRQLPNKRNMSTTSCHLLLCCLPLAPPATSQLPLATCLICAFECFVFTHAHDNARAAPRWP